MGKDDSDRKNRTLVKGRGGRGLGRRGVFQNRTGKWGARVVTNRWGRGFQSLGAEWEKALSPEDFSLESNGRQWEEDRRTLVGWWG